MLPLRPHVTPLRPRDMILTQIRVISIDLSHRFIRDLLPLPPQPTHPPFLLSPEAPCSSHRPCSICLMKAGLIFLRLWSEASDDDAL